MCSHVPGCKDDAACQILISQLHSCMRTAAADAAVLQSSCIPNADAVLAASAVMKSDVGAIAGALAGRYCEITNRGKWAQQPCIETYSGDTYGHQGLSSSVGMYCMPCGPCCCIPWQFECISVTPPLSTASHSKQAVRELSKMHIHVAVWAHNCSGNGAVAQLTAVTSAVVYTPWLRLYNEQKDSRHRQCVLTQVTNPGD